MRAPNGPQRRAINAPRAPVVCTLLVYCFIRFKFHYLPDTIVVVFLGAMASLAIKLSGKDWTSAELLDPTTFFLVLLPPIIFESGYSLHMGNFFRNLGTILLFALLGTLISAMVIGGAVFLLGIAGASYKLGALEAFAFGSLISAVDPVATLAIFHMLDVDPTLNMLVFGESVLNDAVCIVLVDTVVRFASGPLSGSAALSVFGNFWAIFLGSTGIGIVFALVAALLLKHIALRTTPSLEFAVVCIMAYAPYALSESLKLSGIMAILACGIVMAHYTHFNLSPMTQLTAQQVFRTVAYLAETAVFAYLGLAIFSFDHLFSPTLIVWSIVLCFAGRAANIFPLSLLANRLRKPRISPKFQFIMWFSGLRGAIAFALSMSLPLSVVPADSHRVIVTTTLIVVIFTIIVLGGSTMPLIRLIGGYDRTQHGSVTLSKTDELGTAVDADALERDAERVSSDRLSALERFDRTYLQPFFRRRVRRSELRDAEIELSRLSSTWYATLSPEDDSVDGVHGPGASAAAEVAPMAAPGLALKPDEPLTTAYVRLRPSAADDTPGSSPRVGSVDSAENEQSV